MIKWNEYTWYSRLAAVIFFIAVLPVWMFYMGTQYEKTKLVLMDAEVVPVAPYSQHTPASTTTPSTSSTTPVARPGKVDTGVEGIVTIGPTCPVERIPADPACADKPYETTLVLASTIPGRNGGILIKTDSHGYFSHVLTPGTYTIRAQSESMLPRLEPVTFTVRDHKLASLNLQFDSGIR